MKEKEEEEEEEEVEEVVHLLDLPGGSGSRCTFRAHNVAVLSAHACSLLLLLPLSFTATFHDETRQEIERVKG